jgi:predicted regulator of Ras-like GTPase activity (Roadblock/LC7/MglB family)
MGEAGIADGASLGVSHALDIATVEAPIALCSDAGRVQVATGPALALLRRVSVADQPPATVPAELWRLLERTPTGEAVEWRPTGARHGVLGCTRYAAARGSYLLLMREVTAKHVALSERLNRSPKAARWASGKVLRSAVKDACPVEELAKTAALVLQQEARTLDLFNSAEGVEELVLSTTHRCDLIRPLGDHKEFALLVFAPDETNLVMARLELEQFITRKWLT